MSAIPYKYGNAILVYRRRHIILRPAADRAGPCGKQGVWRGFRGTETLRIAFLSNYYLLLPMCLFDEFLSLCALDQRSPLPLSSALPTRAAVQTRERLATAASASQVPQGTSCIGYAEV